MRGPRAVTFTARLAGVRRKGLTEFELDEIDHQSVVCVPEWSHDRFMMGERVRVTVERLDSPPDGERPSDELARWVEDHAGDLEGGHVRQLDAIARRIDERCEDEVAYALAQDGGDSIDGDTFEAVVADAMRFEPDGWASTWDDFAFGLVERCRSIAEKAR